MTVVSARSNCNGQSCKAMQENSHHCGPCWEQDMTGKKTEGRMTTLEASQPDPAEKASLISTVSGSGSSEDSRITKEQGSRRHKLPEVRRFSLRQSRLTVPRPSYARHAGFASWKPATENSDDGTELADSNIVTDESTRLAPSPDVRAVTDTHLSARTGKWAFVAFAILFYIILRMLERSP